MTCWRRYGDRPWIIGDKVYLGDEDGDVAVLETSKMKKRDRRVQHGSSSCTRRRCRRMVSCLLRTGTSCMR